MEFMNTLLRMSVVLVAVLLFPKAAAAQNFVGTDLGEPILQGAVETNAAGGIVLTGSGSGIGIKRDQGYFAWIRETNDFDVAVRVESLSTPDLFGRAGLVARTSLDADGPFAGVFATPNVAGIMFQTRASSGAAGRQAGVFPANYPTAWLRLQRQGDQFTGAASLDGSSWVKLDSATLSTNEPIYLGLTVTSWATNTMATATFRDWTVGSGAMPAAATFPRELPGPSSRRSGLTISEIMYHPESRADGRDLEFIEIFNSHTLFADLSEFRLSGAVEYTFPQGTTVPAGGLLVVARVPADMELIYGLTNVFGPYSRALNNGNETVRLLSRIGAVLVEVPYDSRPPWPVSADGAGHSLVLTHPSYGEGSVQAWGASSWKGGSPGRWDPIVQDSLGAVVINEVRSRSTAPATDFIELYNHSNESVELAGCVVSDRLTGGYTFPAGATIPPRGYLLLDQTTLGFGLDSSGETIYLLAPGQARVLDAVRYEPQPNNSGFGRVTDGAPELGTLTAPSPGAANKGAAAGGIVINEIMFNPISGDADQYVELFNRGAAVVDLGGWRFTAGINFTFPSQTMIAPGAYLVVAKNAVRLREHYTNLTTANCVGDFTGNLSGRGERVSLARPENPPDAAKPGEPLWIEVASVEYVGGGRWGRWSDGGGSSLELTDPHANPALAANWADSDETAKGVWTTIEHTGVLDLGVSNYGINQVQLLLEGIGECLVDNVEVIGPGGTNMVVNGDFENGLSPWVTQGSHKDSTLEPGTGVNGSQCLHLRAESRGDPGANRVRGNVTTGLKEGQVVTLRAQVRWLRGFPEFLVRLRGNYLEAAGRMKTSPDLGTPGRANSRLVSNAPPAIYDVVHSPILPAADQPVVVTARVHDPDGLGSLMLRYRLDPASELTDVAMRDDGTAGDLVAGDGVYSVTIPGQSNGALVAFHVAATDAAATPASGTFPANAPAQECLVRFGESQPGGSFGTYRIWMTQAVRNKWTTREKLNNAPLDVTFVYNNQRVVYNAASLYTGSPFVASGYSSPTGVLCGYAVHFPSDDPFLGATEIKLDWPVRDSSLQMEQVAYWIADQMSLPSNHRRFIFVYVNGSRRPSIYEDAQQPNSNMVAQYFPDDDNGDLYKIDDWFEFDNSASGFNNRDATLENFTTTDGVKKVARYRWNWRKRAVTESANDYRNLFALVDAAQGFGDNFTLGLEAIMDVEEYLGIIAMEHIVGNWDSFGYGRGKNMSTYKPKNGKWNLLTWDIDFVISSDSADPADSYMLGTIDPTISQMFFSPAFQRVYYRKLSEAAAGPLSSNRFTPVLNGNYTALVANGLTPTAPGAGSRYLVARAKNIQTFLADAQNSFALSSGSNTVSTPVNPYLLEGTAPVQAREIRVNGVPYPIRWLDATHWQIEVPLNAASNRLVVAATDAAGRPVGAAKTLQVNYTGAVETPDGHLVFNEVMYRPLVPEADFIEIYNNSPISAYDLSGWRIDGLGYTFPPGTILKPNGYLTVTHDRTAFWDAYGADVVPTGAFPGSLAVEGETLRLVKPGATPMGDRVIAELTYSNQWPWPPHANAGGISLQLRDPSHDPNRVGNWDTRVTSAPPEWELVSVTGKAGSSRLLLYLSGLPPTRDVTSLEGPWKLDINFGDPPATYSLEFRAGQSGGLEGDFFFDVGNGVQRSPLAIVTITNNALVFGFSPDQPEFRFPFSGEVTSTKGRYQPPGQTGWPSTLRRDNPGGDLFIDDLWLTQGTTPGAGTNLLVGADFETPLAGHWQIATNVAGSSVTPDAKHQGKSSLHLVASTGGYTESGALWQDVPLVHPGETYTLSAWVHRGAGALGLVARMADWSLALIKDVQPPKPKPVEFTPGEINSDWATLGALPQVWLNECAPVNRNGPRDAAGDLSPWVELYNSGSTQESLATLLLSNDETNSIPWRFPEQAQLAPGEFHLVWLDGHPERTTASEWHANFRPAPGSGRLLLVRSTVDSAQIVDYLAYSSLPDGSSIGWAADGVPSQRATFPQPTPAQANTHPTTPNVVINEWMAVNRETITDPATGNFDDWFELFNPSPTPADLSGFTLSDSITEPRKFLIPPGTIIPPSGFLLVWADSTPQGPNGDGVLHVNFKLDAAGEAIVLTAPNGATIDAVTFGPQTPDESEGRWPDGAALPFRALTEPTPATKNIWATDLRLNSVQAVGGVLNATWPSSTGQRFQIQYKESISTPQWLNLGDPMQATGEQTEFRFTLPSAGVRFFRVVLLP